MIRIFKFIEKYFFAIMMVAIIVSFAYPNSFNWVLSKYNGINILNLLLSLVLFTMGTTLKLNNFLDVFKSPKEIIVGVVGNLQMEVLEFRLKNEYGVEIKIDILPYRFVRWIETEDVDLDTLDITSDTRLVVDLRGRNILLFQNEWGIAWVLSHNQNLTLTDVGKVD